MKLWKRKLFLIPAGTVVALLSAAGVASAAGVNVNLGQVVGNDQVGVARQWQQYERNQPIPAALWSQYRQTLIDVESAQIHGVATTTFGYPSIAAPHPSWSCPSIGFPVASTSQLTSPEQIISNSNGNGNWDHTAVPQPEPNGTFTGQSSGTYVTCVAPNGTPYVRYEEGYVSTVGGPAHFDNATQQIVLDGAPTVTTQGGR